MKNPTLGVITKGGFKTTRELSQEDYSSLMDASQRLLDFSANQDLLNIARMNHDNFQKTIEYRLIRYARRPKSPKELIVISLDLNRLLLNLLSSVRMYLDHHETYLARKYGEESDRYKTYKAACSKEYDGNFSYRFLYKLRNYAQHCGLPIGSISLSSKIIDWTTKDAEHTLSINFDRDILLTKYDSWGSVRTELEGMPENFAVIPQVVSMMKSLEVINRQLYEDEIAELTQSAKILDRVIDELKDEHGLPTIYDFADVRGPNLPIKFTTFSIPADLVELVKSAFPDRFN